MRFLFFSALTIAFTVIPGSGEEKRPNFLFIYADDLGWGDLACHGHPHILTPNLDRLASEGTDFQQFTVVNPVCSPSRVGIVTGMFPSRLGVHQHFASHTQNVERHMPDWLDPKAPLLPRVLHEAGYRTAHYGKWHLSGGGIADAPPPSVYGYDDSATWTGGDKHVFDGTRFAKMADEGNAHDEQAASFLSIAATDHALEFVRDAHQRGAPFYVNLWLHETHHLVSATENDKKPYPDIEEPYRTYYAAVTRADRQVGRMLALLEELGLSEDTLVVFSSDNGPENSHEKPGQKFYFSQGQTGGLRGRKRSLLMGGVNVPFIVRWPGKVPAGRVDTETPIAGVDVFPTFLAAAGIPVPEGYQGDGENVLAAWKGEPFERGKPVFWYWSGKHGGDDWPTWAMRDGRRVLIVDETEKQRELYDVVADREQSKNLAAEQPDRVASMWQAIKTWRAELPQEIDPSLQTTEPPRNSPAQTGRPPLTREEMFAKKDLNKDGSLTLEEYLHRFPDQEEGKRRFPGFDDNGDGVLSREEFVTPGKK
ncbi:MAG: sulfatase-like hydrolase/transferase [Verrucomicrobiae bacterium]|nr:sulfatase-like hydrolase/transferase [Verrucomicrobiae bacterium]